MITEAIPGLSKIYVSLMRTNWPKLATLAQENYLNMQLPIKHSL